MPYSIALRACLAPLVAAAVFICAQPLSAQPGSLLWEVKPGGRDFGGFSESGGIVTVGNITSLGGIFAYAANSGKLLWSHRGEQMWSSTASDGQRVYAGFHDSAGRRLAAFDLKTGKQIWTTPGESKLGGAFPPIVDNGHIYLINEDGHVDAYNAVSGVRLWQFAYAPEDPECPSGLTLANNRLFFGGGQHNGAHSPGKFLWSIDPATGKELWKYQSHLSSSWNTDCYSTPAVSGDAVVVTSGNTLLALRASTGALLWTKKAEGVSGGYPKPFPLSAPIIANGVVYAARSGAIASWNLTDGKPLPDFPVAAFSADPERVHLYADGNTLFFLGDLAADIDSKPGRCPLHAMDIPTHKILWTHRVNREVRFLETWSTREILITPTAIYYDNNSLIAKVAR